MKTTAELREAALAAFRDHEARTKGGTVHRTIELEIDREELARRKAAAKAARAERAKRRAAAGARAGTTPPNPNENNNVPNGGSGQHDGDEEFADDGDEEFEDSLLPISLSSEHPVERYDFWNDETYDEVLEHSHEAIDTSRTRGMPFLVDHNHRDYDAHIGTIENFRLDLESKKTRGDVRFSKREFAQCVRCDMEDGIRSKISVGYNVDFDHMEVLRPAKGETGKTRITYKRWTPLEGSSVAIPADENVGVGRSGDGWTPDDLRALRETIREMQDNSTAGSGQGGAVPEGQRAANTPAASTDLTVVRAEVRDEIKRISDLATTHHMEDQLPKWLGANLDERAVREAIIQRYQENAARPVADPAVLDLTEKERKRYSHARAIGTLVAAVEGKGDRRSFETEIAEELEKMRPKGLQSRGGLLMPICMSKDEARMHNACNDAMVGYRGIRDQLQMRAGLDSITSGKGQELKFTVPGEFLMLLRNFMAVYAAGASYLTGLQGPVAYPQQIGAATATWVAEDPGSDVADSTLTLQQVPLTPKTIQASTSYSRQLWIQSVIDIDAAVKQDLALITAIALDLAAIAGTGASNQPTGILNWAGTSAYAEGANGATPTYNDLVNIETLITAANADQWPLTYLFHPTTRGTFKKAVPLGNTSGLPVWTDSKAGVAGEPALQAGGTSRKRGELNGYDAYASAQVPNNLTKGTSSGICLAGVFGAFPTLVIGDWGMFEIIVDPYRLKKQGMIELTSFAMYGIALKFAAAFATVKDLLP